MDKPKRKSKRSPRNLVLVGLLVGAILLLFVAGLILYIVAPRDQWLVYVQSGRESNNIMRMPLGKPNEAVNLTQNIGFNDMPAVSPDGRRIAFASPRDSFLHDIYVIDVHGGNLVNLTQTPNLTEAEPAWSPDGRQIAFTSNRNGGLHIYIMNADGSDMRQLTSGRGVDGEPAWWPDGTHIAFSSGSGTGPDIFVIGVDGSNLTNLTQSEKLLESSPAWSPDGTDLAYSAQAMKADGQFSGDGDIYVMTLATGAVRQLTDHPEGDRQPIWTPDSAWLIFVSERDWGGGKLYRIRPDGTDLQPLTLTEERVTETHPAWLGTLR